MRLTVVVVLALAAACRFDASGVPGGSEAPDANPDAPDAEPGAPDADTTPDAADPCLSFAATHFDACLIPDPAGDLTLSGDTFTYDTETGTFAPTPPGGDPPTDVIAQSAGPMIRVISVNTFAVDGTATINVVGPHPLVVAGWVAINVDGTINVNSTRNGRTGAGADPTAECAAQPGAGQGTTTSGDGRGGGGGGFQGAGGAGGDANNGGGTGGAGGGATDLPAFVRGGCPGADGGGANNGEPGGGAIQLTANGPITFGGTINAGGAGGGGTGSGTTDGGGGAGSGGYIGLEGITVDGAGSLYANGGGGGGGDDNNVGGGGQGGENGKASTNVANGGNGDAGGDGGDGSVNATLTGSPGGTGNDGGGGGGGGAGYIIVLGTSTLSGGEYSPAISP